MTRAARAEARSGRRAGFVAIIGRPNAGKSTLLNRFAGQKIAIVSPKPQTTRNRIQGIVTRAEGQIVFVDTPGLHQAESVLGRQMMREVTAALEGIDMLLAVVDASAAGTAEDEALLQKVRSHRGPVLLALNKVDRMAKEKLLPLMDAYGKQFDYAAMVPISALAGDGCDRLLAEIFRLLPEGEGYFPEDAVTDQPERFLAGEIVREKAIHFTRDEVPHALAVVVEKYEEGPRLLRIYATIQVERGSQKKIVIGGKGAMLKKIGTAARKELEEILGSKVFLELYVKVAPRWRENPGEVGRLDWHKQLEDLTGGEYEE